MKKDSKLLITGLLGFLFVILGIVFIFILFRNSQVLLQTGIQTTALIKDIEIEKKEFFDAMQSEDTNAMNQYTTHINYTAVVEFKTEDGTTTTGKLGHYNSSMKQGDLIEIIYNPDNPSEITTAGQSKFWLFGGIISMTVGLVFLLLALRMYIQKQKMPENSW